MDNNNNNNNNLPLHSQFHLFFKKKNKFTPFLQTKATDKTRFLLQRGCKRRILSTKNLQPASSRRSFQLTRTKSVRTKASQDKYHHHHEILRFQRGGGPTYTYTYTHAFPVRGNNHENWWLQIARRPSFPGFVC